MTSLSPHGRRRVGSTSDQDQPKQYPSLKKSLSASYALSSTDEPNAPDNPHHGFNNAPSTPRQRAQTEPPVSTRPSAPAEVALAALHYLPTPLLVLSSMKTVILANEAMGRLLGLEPRETRRHEDADVEDAEDDESMLDRLVGRSLSEIGINIIQNGQRIWVGWERFLDNLIEDMDHTAGRTEDSTMGESALPGLEQSLQPTGTPLKAKKLPSSKVRHRSLVHDAVIQVTLSPQILSQEPLHPSRSRGSPAVEVQANMIISIWHVGDEDERYYTCTFTGVSSTPLTPMRTHARVVSGALNQATSSSSTQSSSSSPRTPISPSSLPSPAFTSPDGIPLSIAPFPPLAPPSKTSIAISPPDIQKLLRMKDAIIDAMKVPVMVMWHDESLTIQNKAVSRLFHGKMAHTDGNPLQMLSQFKCYTEDFERQLEPEEYPIIQLVRNRKPFNGWKIGLEDPQSERRHFECNGECILDEATGEFIAGITVLTDVTEYKDIIKAQHEENDQQFELICDTMPQLLWTTDAHGAHDWFSRRWYDYTGLSVEQCMGEGWINAFNEDDVKEAEKRWRHSLETGDEYSTEYRCRSSDGHWKWMLGRALPLRDSKSNKIVKWFGTCTDIHELVEARQEAKRTREQLLNVIKHANVTVWAVDMDRKLTFLEGKLMWDEDDEDVHEGWIGDNIYDVFGRNRGKLDLPLYKEPIEGILNGEANETTQEHHINGNGRWFRTRFVPTTAPKEDPEEGNKVTGIIGISMDVTELKDREADLQSQEKENLRLLSAETAAKEASRLKSQFLANMSHEIRTPIAGVIGMSDLLLDTGLDQEQRECAENIQRSANGLLTVINDILDLSKVESGRLDIEEVQFCLSIVISDVCKMLSFAAERKNLIFESDIQIGTEKDVVVMGDPGRVRQILTNLLTNSIKFTSEGSVKLAVAARKETAETIEVVFKVEDTGIGIEEEVRKRLFKPFSQADSSTARRFGGTGLGLTICKNLVNLMHGEISLESALDSGTTATFWIPFNKPQFTGGSSPMVDLGGIPDRLRSEMSVSGCPSASDLDRGSATPPQPQSPLENLGVTPSLRPQRSGSLDLRKQVGHSLDLDGTMSDVDRKKTHVLVVEDNAINQQIALKTVKKFGFSVTAVWNGQQALDYLLEKPSPSHPRPDIILMDVQMPILDGYRATHLIRHHKPYAAMDSIRAIPIVAMTASAIQGDKEKCQRAGMDDYLAKPVRGPTLEKMLIKWAVEGRNLSRLEKITSNLQHADDSSNCPSMTDHNQSTPDLTAEPETLHNGASPPPPRPGPSQSSTAKQDSRPPAAPITSSSLRALSSEGDRGLQRAEAEEKATSLRDDKLIAATEPNPSFTDTPNSAERVPTVQKRSHAARPSLTRTALTEENIGQLNKNQAEDKAVKVPPALKVEDSTGQSSSLWVGESEGTLGSPGLSSSGRGKQRSEKSGLGRKVSDRSESTLKEDENGT